MHEAVKYLWCLMNHAVTYVCISQPSHNTTPSLLKASVTALMSSQGLWALSAAAITPVYMSILMNSVSAKPLPIIPNTHVDVVSGAAAATSFVGELFMLKALLVYRDKNTKSRPGVSAGGHSAHIHRLWIMPVFVEWNGDMEHLQASV